MRTNEPPATRLRPPRFGKTLQRSIRETWNHLGTVMVVNCAVFIAITVTPSAADFLIAHTGIAGWFFLVGVEMALAAFCFGLLASFARKLLAREEITLASLWLDGRRLFWLSLRVALLDAIIIGILIANTIFYFTRFTLIGSALAFFIFDMLIFAFALGYLQPAVLADADSEQAKGATSEKIGPVAILRRSGLIFLLESKFVFASYVLTALMGVILLVSIIGLPIIGFGFAAIYITCVHQEIMACYGLAPEPFDPSKPVEDDWKGIAG